MNKFFVFIIIFVLSLVIVGVLFVVFEKPKIKFSPEDSARCVEFDVSQSSLCRGDIGLLNVNFFVCGKFFEPHTKDLCYYEIAYQENDKSICEKISHPLIKSSCRKY